MLLIDDGGLVLAAVPRTTHDLDGWLAPHPLGKRDDVLVTHPPTLMRGGGTRFRASGSSSSRSRMVGCRVKSALIGYTRSSDFVNASSHRTLWSYVQSSPSRGSALASSHRSRLSSSGLVPPVILIVLHQQPSASPVVPAW